MTDTRTFRVVDEDGDWYETTGDPCEALERTGTERDGAYRERAHLVALLAAQYPAELREDPEDEDGEWSIVYVDLPTGQASWHIHPRDMDLFPHVKFGTDAEWDGHSTEEKYRRVNALTQQLHAAAEQ